MIEWPRIALERLGEPLALVTLLAVEGSAPRDAGTRMLVWPGGQWGTIGGGNLEHQATTQARRVLEGRPAPPFVVQDYPLGPLLGQCCGGRVRLLIEALGPADAAWLADADRHRRAGRGYHIRRVLAPHAVERSVAADDDGFDGVEVSGQAAGARGDRPGRGDTIRERVTIDTPRLLLFGAGHVGRALDEALAPLPFQLEWFDSRAEVAGAAGARCADPAALAALAVAGAPFILVLTHDHALDYALVLAALGEDETGAGGYLGLIGSATKHARFSRRLKGDGVSPAALSRLVCPIGLAAITGKAPPVIAASVAADLLIRREALIARREARHAGL